MRRIVVLLLFASVQVFGQRPSEEEAVLRALGVLQMEEADAEDVERLTDLLRHPVKINAAGRRDLESTGLFTPFQIASLLDYRERHGDVMSFIELSSVDGFTTQAAGRLEPFLTFDSGSLARKARQQFKGEINARTAKEDEKLKIPLWLDFERCNSLRYESREKLKHVKPETLAQASRIPGVNPADIALLGIIIRRGHI